MIFGAYLDESGTHDDTLLVVSAYVAEAEAWKAFSEAWSSILGKYRVSHMHCKDFKNSHSKLYRHLNRSERHELLSECISCINTNVLFGFVVAFQPSLYNKLTDSSFRNDYGSAYSFAVELCVSGCLEVLQDRGDEGDFLNVILEEGHPRKREALDHLDRVKSARSPIPGEHDIVIVAEVDPLRSPGTKIGSIGDGSKLGDNAFLPLQAADMLAYCTNAEIRKASDPFASEAMTAVEHGTPHYGYLFREEELFPKLVKSLKEDGESRGKRRRHLHEIRRTLGKHNIKSKTFPYGIQLDLSNASRSDVVAAMEDVDFEFGGLK